MKIVILIKPCNETQLAHLYEHLYVNALDEFFRKNRLLSYLDYHTKGRTFEYGMTMVEVALYTTEAITLENQISHIGLDLSYDVINGCLGEIVAEKRVALIGDGTIEHELAASLRALHAQPWAHIDDFGVLDGHTTRRSFKKLWLSSDKVRTKTLKCSLVLDQTYAANSRHLWPLFWLVSLVINDNLLRSFARLGIGYYFLDSLTTFTNKKVQRDNIYRAWIPNARRLDEELIACQSAIHEMLEYGLVARLVEYLQTISYASKDDNLNETGQFEGTGIFVGAAGWREIGTRQNVLELLEHTTLWLVYGKASQELPLASLLESQVKRIQKTS